MTIQFPKVLRLAGLAALSCVAFMLGCDSGAPRTLPGKLFVKNTSPEDLMTLKATGIAVARKALNVILETPSAAIYPVNEVIVSTQAPVEKKGELFLSWLVDGEVDEPNPLGATIRSHWQVQITRRDAEKKFRIGRILFKNQEIYSSYEFALAGRIENDNAEIEIERQRVKQAADAE